MARFVQAGPSAGIALINPQAYAASNEDFFRARVMQAYDPSSEFGRQMVQEALQRTEAINGFEAMHAAKVAAEQIRSMSGTSDYMYLWTPEQFQAASPVMINWIMTDERLQAMYQRGRIEGWADTYINHAPGNIGADNEAYCALNNGILIDDAQAGWKFHVYQVDWGATEPLSIRNIDLIKSAQERLLHLIETAGEGSPDPTSQYGATF